MANFLPAGSLNLKNWPLNFVSYELFSDISAILLPLFPVGDIMMQMLQSDK